MPDAGFRPRRIRIRILTLIFIALSTISLVYISVVSANYVTFYPSLASVSEQISRVTYQRDPVSNQTSITVHVIVDHPKDYSGLIVKFFDVKVRFLPTSSSSNASLFTTYPLTTSLLVNKPIPPHTQITGDVVIVPTQDQASQLAAFNNTYYPLNVHCDLTVRISTFLDTVTGFVLYVSEQTLQLS